MSADNRITVYSDYVCPFCYLGRLSLEEYQETRERELRIPPAKYFDAAQAASISIPTLLLIGEESPDHLKEDTEPVIDALPQAEVEVLSGQAHSADIVAPELVAENILAFRDRT